MRFPLRPALLTLVALKLSALTVEEFASTPGVWENAAPDKTLRKAGYEWTSQAKDTLRATKGGSLAGHPLGETLIRLDTKAGHPSSLETLFYNRGDDGEITEKDFEKKLAAIRDALGKSAGVKAVELKRSRRSAVRADAMLWATPSVTWYLEWSKNRETRRPEFIRLELHPPAAAKQILRDAADAGSMTTKGYAPADHLETTPAGDRRIKDVPMVDQGQKGYCAVATTERVLRLYGLPVDEHELAQLADSTGDGGTNPDKLIEAFRKNSSRLKVRPQILQDWDIAFFDSYATDYNNAARKAKRPLLPSPRRDWPGFVQTFPDSRTSPIRVEGRKTNASGIKRFEKQIAGAIDKGLPVIWGVTLGLVQETPALPQASGGHMRIIIGYNAAKHTVIYSDSWGAGHEFKSMPAAEAFAITDTLFTLAP